MQQSPITVRANQLFGSMIDSAHKQGKGTLDMELSVVLVGIDPGETTGFAYHLPWDKGFTAHLAQIPTGEINSGMDNIEEAWPVTDIPTVAVIEDYRIYGWKADSHKWAGLHTPKLIGALEYWCYKRRIPVIYQMAQEAKAWATDEKLKSWELYHAGMKHARDALRHLVTAAFFKPLPTFPKRPEKAILIAP